MLGIRGAGLVKLYECTASKRDPVCNKGKRQYLECFAGTQERESQVKKAERK